MLPLKILFGLNVALVIFDLVSKGRQKGGDSLMSIIKFAQSNKDKCKVNVDHPTKTVVIHGPKSKYGPVKGSQHKQDTSSGNFGRDGGWFTGLSPEKAEEIASQYEAKGYKVKEYGF